MLKKSVSQKDDGDNKIRLLIEHGKGVENPSFSDILVEIQMVFINPVRDAESLLDFGDADKKTVSIAETILHTMLLNRDKFFDDVSDFSSQRAREKRKSTPEKSLFKFMEDPRFIEYKSQVELDGGNITDILEAWLKEHNPDFFKDN